MEDGVVPALSRNNDIELSENTNFINSPNIFGEFGGITPSVGGITSDSTVVWSYSSNILEFYNTIKKQTICRWSFQNDEIRCHKMVQHKAKHLLILGMKSKRKGKIYFFDLKKGVRLVEHDKELKSSIPTAIEFDSTTRCLYVGTKEGKLYCGTICFKSPRRRSSNNNNSINSNNCNLENRQSTIFGEHQNSNVGEKDKIEKLYYHSKLRLLFIIFIVNKYNRTTHQNHEAAMTTYFTVYYQENRTTLKKLYTSLSDASFCESTVPITHIIFDDHHTSEKTTSHYETSSLSNEAMRFWVIRTLSTCNPIPSNEHRTQPSADDNKEDEDKQQSRNQRPSSSFFYLFRVLTRFTSPPSSPQHVGDETQFKEFDIKYTQRMTKRDGKIISSSSSQLLLPSSLSNSSNHHHHPQNNSSSTLIFLYGEYLTPSPSTSYMFIDILPSFPLSTPLLDNDDNNMSDDDGDDSSSTSSSDYQRISSRSIDEQFQFERIVLRNTPKMLRLLAVHIDWFILENSTSLKAKVLFANKYFYFLIKGTTSALWNSKDFFNFSTLKFFDLNQLISTLCYHILHSPTARKFSISKIKEFHKVLQRNDLQLTFSQFNLSNFQMFYSFLLNNFAISQSILFSYPDDESSTPQSSTPIPNPTPSSSSSTSSYLSPYSSPRRRFGDNQHRSQSPQSRSAMMRRKNDEDESASSSSSLLFQNNFILPNFASTFVDKQRREIEFATMILWKLKKFDLIYWLKKHQHEIEDIHIPLYHSNFLLMSWKVVSSTSNMMMMVGTSNDNTDDGNQMESSENEPNNPNDSPRSFSLQEVFEVLDRDLTDTQLFYYYGIIYYLLIAHRSYLRSELNNPYYTYQLEIDFSLSFTLPTAYQKLILGMYYLDQPLVDRSWGEISQAGEFVASWFPLILKLYSFYDRTIALKFYYSFFGFYNEFVMSQCGGVFDNQVEKIMMEIFMEEKLTPLLHSPRDGQLIVNNNNGDASILHEN